MRLSLMVALVALLAVLVGCSGGGGMPVTPGIPGGEITDFGEVGESRMGSMPDAGNFLWGYWQGSIDLATKEIEMIPKRQVEFHANLASILQNHPLGLTYKFKGFDMIEKAVDVDVTITHPYPNSDFRGFDMRGIFMGPGNTLTSKTDPGVIYPALDGTRVLNADGYTRWWNAIEFTTAGMYGYDDNIVFADFILPETTLNPYKYFADCLEAEDAVMPNVNSSNRGTFSTEGSPPSATRRYRIQFPTIGGYMKFVFHYAVDVNWAAPINGHPTPKPIEDFPPEANCPEPFHIEVDATGSTAFYKDEVENGGDLQLALEIFDWQAEENPLGIDGEIESIWLESETLFDPIYINDVIPQPGSQPNSGIYEITIPDVTPAGSEDQEILITVRSTDPNTYAPPVSGPAYPEGAYLSSYALVEIPVSDIEIPDIHLLSPNGDEILMAGASCTIEWETSQYVEIEKISILLSTNSGTAYDKGIALNIANTGSYIFYNIPETYIGCYNRIKILDADHPSVFDESDCDFTILPQLEDQIIVTVPNGGEEWIAGTNEDIKWVGDPNIPDVTIKLSGDMGQTWPVTVVESTPNADGVFNWGLIPQEHIGPNCRIGIFDVNSPSIFDISDSNFSIAEPGIELLTPNGGEVLEVGDAYEITWKASDIISNILIEMSSDSGGTYPDVVIGLTPNTGSFTWDPIDNWPETFNARIRISDVDNPGLYSDESHADFVFLERGLTLNYPDGGQEWRLGFPQTIEWVWTGNIPIVDITMSIDGGGFDTIIVENHTNAGLLEIASFYPSSLTQDHAIWNTTELGVKFKVSASDTSTLNDASESDITVPISLGILDDKNAAASGDDDDDGVKDGIEMMLAMMEDDIDSDRDGMYDYKELFNESGWGWEDLIPDQDGDNTIAPLDNDDNQDGVHDGELVDSDMDGVPNYLEYYGFTYNWLSGEFLKWDDEDVQEDFSISYFKTDPLQPSSDQDPYGDGMEVSGLLMDQSVTKPGNCPMVPACPDVIFRLEGYQVTLNADIENAEGGSASKEQSWSRESSWEHGWNIEHHWEIGAEYAYKWGTEGGSEVRLSGSVGGSYTYNTTITTGQSQGSSITEGWDWSTTRSVNPTEAAKIKLLLKAYNMGTACASNIIPTLTLKVGRNQVATFTTGDSQINILPPGGVYPPGQGEFWVVDSVGSGEPIYLTESELKSIESGAPVTITVPQMQAGVAALNDQGYWEYVGDWGEFMVRVNAVCATLYFDCGNGDSVFYKVYADDDPSSPEITFADALKWAAGLEEIGDSLFINYRLADGSWTKMDLDNFNFQFDPVTWATIQNNLDGDKFYLMDIPLTPGATIIAKAPPGPDQENPIVHWASYDEVTMSVLASAADYLGIEAVYFVDVNPSGTEYEITFDDSLGCYRLIMPSDFVLEPGVDYVYAINTAGYESDPPFEIFPMADPLEPPVESYPQISDSSLTLSERFDLDYRLDVIVEVIDPVYDVEHVYLIGSDGSIIFELDHWIGDIWHKEINHAISVYMPQFNEKIQAFNSWGYSTTIPIPSANMTAPDPIYAKYTIPIYPPWNIWHDPDCSDKWYVDIDNYEHETFRTSYSDFQFCTVPQLHGRENTLNVLKLDITDVRYFKLDNFPEPNEDMIINILESNQSSRDWFLLGLTEADPKDIGIELYDSLIFRTTENRYGYFAIWDPYEYAIDEYGPYELWVTVFSLYEGPYPD